MTWTRAWMNNFWLLSHSRATEDPKCFVGIDTPDSFKFNWLIQKKKKRGCDNSDNASTSRFLATCMVK